LVETDELETRTAGSETELEALVASVTYKPGWKFRLGGPGGRFVCIFATTPDSMDPTRERTTQHMFEVPDDPDLDLVRWLYDRLTDCERHEIGEFYEINGSRPFFPYHQDEGSPYVIVDRRLESNE
jgi:hypothetical protein